MQQYVVGKPFAAEGRQYQAGEVVDPSAWRNAKALISQRYLRLVPAPPATLVRPKGRKATDAEPSNEG